VAFYYQVQITALKVGVEVEVFVLLAWRRASVYLLALRIHANELIWVLCLSLHFTGSKNLLKQAIIIKSATIVILWEVESIACRAILQDFVCEALVHGVAVQSPPLLIN
jgi:hypothetical protein